MSYNANLISRTSYKNFERLKKTTDQSIEKLGIDIFGHWTLNEKGEFAYFTNVPELCEFFFSHELYKGHPIFKHPKHIPSGFLLPEKENNLDWEVTQGKMDEFGSIHQHFVMVENNKNYTSGYWFASFRGKPDLTNIYLNQLMTLRRFINFFHEEHAGAVRQSKECSVNIAECIGMSFSKPSQLFSQVEPNSDTIPFLDAKSKFVWNELKALSFREKECLKWLLKGKSAKQIGQYIHLSPRTVESYLARIKDKFCCKNKEQLFEQLLQFNDYLHLIIF